MIALPKKIVKHIVIVCSLFLDLKLVSSLLNEASIAEDQWRKYTFTSIYRANFLKSAETVSGPDSTLKSTSTLRLFLPVIIEVLKIKSMLDAGCGDINWIKETPLNIDYYIGIDIVRDLIEKNSELYASNWCTFKELDMVKDPLPHVDFILCRDVLEYLSFKDIIKVFGNFKKTGASYICISSCTHLKENKTDIFSGNCRFINFQCSPFNFPEPLIAFDELSAEGDMKPRHKKICVWNLKDVSAAIFKETCA